VSKLDHMVEPEAIETLRRLEVITGTGRRRRFSDEFKGRVIEETLTPGVVVSEIARRHGLTPQQLFTRRRQARPPVPPAPSGADQGTPSFVPAIVDSAVPAQKPRRRARRQVGETYGLCGIISLRIDGMTVQIGRGADAKTIAAVLRALEAAT
jgi:transposase